MSDICCECGRKYKELTRTKMFQDDQGQWCRPKICKQCWSGTILVAPADDIRCDVCNTKDCARAEALLADWKDRVRDSVHEKYGPKCGVAFEEASYHGTYYATESGVGCGSQSAIDEDYEEWSGYQPDTDVECDYKGTAIGEYVTVDKEGQYHRYWENLEWHDGEWLGNDVCYEITHITSDHADFVARHPATDEDRSTTSWSDGEVLVGICISECDS